MSISILRFIPAAILIVLGIAIMAIQTLGIFRIHYVLNRMHAAAMGDSLGIFLITAGLILIYGISLVSLKLLFLLILFWFAAPVCSHLLSKLEVSTNAHLDEECEVEKDDRT